MQKFVLQQTMDLEAVEMGREYGPIVNTYLYRYNLIWREYYW